MNFRMLFRLLLVITFSGFSCHCSFAQAQQIFDSTAQRFAYRDSLYSSSQLYLHTDKTVYTGNENIWFTAYLLKAVDSLQKYNTLYVSLSHAITHEVVASSQFVMDGGIAAGELFVADSFPAGDYNLIAYTNMANREYRPGLFQQRVTLRFSGGDPFRVEFEAGKETDSIRFLARVTNKAMLNATGASFDYALYNDDKEVQKRHSVVSPFGEVPVTLPDDPAFTRLEMQAVIQKEKQKFATRLPLAFLEKQLIIRWYPESGDWINGIKTRTAFEITDRSGKPVSVKGNLLQDGKPVLSFQSSSSGIGVIEFAPVAGKTYTVSLNDAEKKLVSANFPEVKIKGATMQVKQAVVTDSLQVRIQSNTPGEKMYLLIHNYRQLFDLWELNLKNTAASLKIPTELVGSGIATLTLFNAAMQPLAERSFIAGYDSLPVVKIATDSSTYHKRSKVDLELNVHDAKGQPLNASVSMATVLTRSVDTTRFKDVIPYRLFQDYIDMGVIPPVSMYGIGDRDDLEMTLLIRCWTRYKDPAPDSVIRSALKNKDLAITGKVKASGKRNRNKPVELTVLAGSGLKMVTTDSSGRFSLPADITALQSHEKLNLIVNEKNKEDFPVEVNHDADSVNKALAALNYPEAKGVKAVMPWVDESLAEVKTLSAVVVKSKITSWTNDPGSYTSQTCSDYVCSYNILNCPNHRTGSPAVEGETYSYQGRMVVYHCPGRNTGPPAELFVKLKGRYYSKDFYVADYATFNPPDPEKHSTVYWSQQIPVINGKAQFSFYTNDLPGAFSIIVEGISDAGPVSGRHSFYVTE
ncbi:MAG: hypothetical protein DI535_16625 [Citrobacter freundii]|nr:MAG: hypothetical protein DI535_16625 [Citrobacter freundii]